MVRPNGLIQLSDNQVTKFQRPDHPGPAAPAEDPADNLVQPIDLERQCDAAVLVLADLLRVMPDALGHSGGGFLGEAGYPDGKVIDNSSEVFSTGVGGNTTSFSQNPFDTAKAEHAVSGIDYPHVFGLAFIYDLPFGRGKRFL